jgi:ribonuclease R
VRLPIPPSGRGRGSKHTCVRSDEWRSLKRKTNLSNEKPVRRTRARTTAALLSAATPLQQVETKRPQQPADAPFEPIEAPEPPIKVSKAKADAAQPARSSRPPKSQKAQDASEEATARFEYQIPEREAILAELRSGNMPLMPAELASRLGVAVEEMPGFDRRLAAMERDGQLMPNRKGVLLLANKLDFVAGRVVGHRDGYGFLVRDDRASPDIWLAPKEMLKVLHGDRVLIKLTGTDYRGKPEGTIVEVTERRTKRLVGRLLSERGVFVVVPEDQRIKHDILIPPGETKKAQPGQVVTVEIVEQPSRYTQPIGRIDEVLGEIDDPGMEIEIAVRKFDVPHIFSPSAEAEAEALPDAVRPIDAAGRVDLTDVPFVTIDGEDARDFDDAVYCEPLEGRKKGWRLLVAIADVSHYVRVGAALDRDAFERSTSVYFPRRVIPMLPEKISNGLCSLVPHVDRLAVVCDMVVSVEGEVTAYQFYNAVIHSAARLTYNEVWTMLSTLNTSGIGSVAPAKQAMLPMLQHLYAVYHAFSEARERRGAIDFETTETYIVADAQGRIEEILPRTRNDAHKLIEECMLAANVCAADLMARKKHDGLYRVHDGPTPEKLANLRAFLKTLGLSLAGGDDPHASDYAAVITRIKHRPDAPLLQTMLLRSMQQAIYSPDNGGHFGLAYPAYAHFTSPIRRYPDLLVHRVLKALIANTTYVPHLPDRDAEDHGHAPITRGAPSISRDASDRQHIHGVWEQFGLQCSANERRADEASRDVLAWLKCYFMREKVGEQFRGTVTGVAPFGIFVTLDGLFVEGLVHVSELGTDYFQFNEAMHELRGERTGQRFRLTDPVTVQVARVDLEARKIEFRLVRGSSYQELMRGVLPDDANGDRKGPPRSPGKRAAKPRSIVPREHAQPGESPALRARAARKAAMTKSGRSKKR